MSVKVFPKDFRQRMKTASPAAIAGAIIGVLVLAGATFGFTTLDANIISPAVAKDYSGTFGLNDLRPQACIDHNITISKVSSGGLHPSALDNNGDLILADSSSTDMHGGNGDDCIVANSGASIDGGPGTNDVCIGNMATSMSNCEIEIRT